MNAADQHGRTIGLTGATLVGVGAIVGGGILALAGTAFVSAGPAAIIAFALNGVIAFITARSFAGMAAVFPQSGGSYTFAKMVLSVRAAFAVGWVVWFASIAAGVLYALGFAVYFVIILERLLPMANADVPTWVRSKAAIIGLAAAATAVYSWNLIRKAAGGGNLETVGKIVIFVIFIAAGLWLMLTGTGADPVAPAGAPVDGVFFHNGFGGLIAAMGFCFIALQGFDLIAAIAGEIKDPERTIPRSMYLSLVIALVIYLPLLLVVMTVGLTPDQTVVQMSEANADAVIAIAAENVLGETGFWLIVVAALLSMLSALQANLFAASRIARAMARDRTLPWAVGHLHPKSGTPVGGVLASAVLLLLILFVIPDVASAGAAASLIFLLTFALVHGMNVLAQVRRAIPRTRTNLTLAVVGALLCGALAIFQGVVVPMAGLIALVWLGVGAVIYATLFARRAEAVDAGAIARNVTRAELRGYSPLVMAPIANPEHAAALVSVAQALAPPRIGRVMLLSVMRTGGTQGDPDRLSQSLSDTQAVLQQALTASFSRGIFPEALCTAASEPWPEIARVARVHNCQSLLLGMSKISDENTSGSLESVMNAVDSDVVVLRAKPDWEVESAKKILVPLGGKGMQDGLRAHLLGSLERTGERQVTWMRVVSANATDGDVKRARHDLQVIASEETEGVPELLIVRSDHALDAVCEASADADMLILGLQRVHRRKKLFGSFVMQIARQTEVPLLLMSRGS